MKVWCSVLDRQILLILAFLPLALDSTGIGKANTENEGVNDFFFFSALLFEYQVHIKKFKYREKVQYVLSIVSESETHII